MVTVMQLALALERLIFERCLQSRLWEKKNVRRPGIEPGSAIWNMIFRPRTLVQDGRQDRGPLSSRWTNAASDGCRRIDSCFVGRDGALALGKEGAPFFLILRLDP
jgi:hypothetical protein